MRRKESVSLALLAILWTAGVSGAADAISLSLLEGTYLSSMQGGCSLELHKDAAFTFMCLSQPVRKGRVQIVDNSIKIEPTGPIPYAIIGRWLPYPVPRDPDSPAAAQDPTSGPFVPTGPDVGQSLRLTPLRWGTRVYLIRNGDYRAFCEAIKAGQEPRKEPGGEHFLRRGDHEKPTAPRMPIECEAMK